MKKILVIEDCAGTRNLFLECLEAEGFYTIGAENGLVGVHLAQEQLPNLIICDIVMPQLDGYGVLSTLRQDPVTAVIPFIFVTAKVTMTDLRLGMHLGADDYLIKPCTVDQLLGVIAVRLEKHTTLQRHYTAQFQIVSEPPQIDTASIAAQQSVFPSFPPLSKVFDFIEANYNRSITLNDVAQAAGYSPAYLTNLVGRETGKTLYCWIIERRMAEARSLLLETNHAVNQIAANLGYRNASSFTRQFCQFHGASPQAWKASVSASLAQTKAKEFPNLVSKRR